MSKAVSKRDRLPNFSNYDSFRIHSIKTDMPKLLRKLQSVFNIRWTIFLYSLCHDYSSVYELPALDVLVHIVLVPALVLAVGAAPPPGQLHHLRHDLRVQCWEYQAFIWTSSRILVWEKYKTINATLLKDSSSYGFTIFDATFAFSV